MRPDRSLRQSCVFAVAVVVATQALTGETSSQDRGRLYNSSTFVTNPGATDGAFADFNGDGRVDIATAGSIFGPTPAVAVHLHDPTTLYASFTTYPLSQKIARVAIGDIQNDGKLDLFVTHSDSSGIPGMAVFHGDGNGGFQLAFDASLGALSADAVSADFNGDGLSDVALAHGIVNAVTVHYNNGASGFLPAHVIVQTNATTAETADVNHDGFADLMSMSGSGTCRLYLGKAALSLDVGTPITIDAIDVLHTTGDFNLDGFVDFAATAQSFLKVYRGDGAGGFALQFQTGMPSSSVPVFADMNTDGKVDVVLGGAFAMTLLGNGAGMFSLKGQCPIAGGLEAIVTDTDGDGHLDYVSTGTLNGEINVAFGDGTGGYRGVKPIQSSVNGFFNFSDLNGDGSADAVISGSATFTIGAYLNDGTGTLIFTGGVPLPISPRGVDLGDMNGDGAPDVLAVRDSGTGGSRIECLLNSGTGGLLPPISTTSSPPDLANRIRTADFNLDGDLDVLACHYFPNGLLRLFHGNGTGVLVPAFSATTQIMAHGLDVADLNGDGYVDAALSAGDSGPVSGNLFIFLNGPAGLGLSNQVPISFGSTPQSPIVALAIGDLNEDGAADIVNTSDNSSFVFLGTGGGSFTPPVPFDTQGTLPQIVKVTDVDADGNADVLFMDIYGGTGMVAYFGDGVGGFSESHRYISTGYGFDVADVDTDGKPDIGFASGYGSMVILNSRREPAGIERFGVGTPGCIGRYGISVNMDPKVNTPGFAVVGTNAPASSLGLGAYATAASVPGVDLFGTGLLLHLDFLASNEVGLFDPVSDAGGNAWIGVPIPNLPVLAGAVYYLQLFWLVGPTDDCDATTTNGLTSSLGLKVTIAP